ncbi:unnamed protein product [Vicia faba]|uniref:Uncharacterized protein n=1 Tax=Vicia faba TaxID=3906 RepID=A0AAV1AFG1_VICFA|nr:unnamed protein product [Vicia faba]
MVLGDFNDILAKEDRIGKRVKYSNNSDLLTCVNTCHLEDIKYNGNYYTWNNRQQGDDKICSKIDRALAKNAWLNCFPNAEVYFPLEGNYYHSPAILSAVPDMINGKKPFRYFRMWKYPNFKEIIKDSWYKHVAGFNNLQDEDNAAKKTLEACQHDLNRDPLNHNAIKKEKEAREKAMMAQKAYCNYLSQKAKHSWIKEGRQEF